MITATPDEEGTLAAARAGADGYLAKHVRPGRLPYIVRGVVAGETAFPRLLLRQLLWEIRPPALPPRPQPCLPNVKPVQGPIKAAIR